MLLKIGPKTHTEKLRKKAQENEKKKLTANTLTEASCVGGVDSYPNERGFCYVGDGVHLR